MICALFPELAGLIRLKRKLYLHQKVLKILIKIKKSL